MAADSRQGTCLFEGYRTSDPALEPPIRLLEHNPGSRGETGFSTPREWGLRRGRWFDLASLSRPRGIRNGLHTGIATVSTIVAFVEVGVRSPRWRPEKGKGASRPGFAPRLLIFSFVLLPGCLGDRAVFESALEGVTVERMTTERYPPTISLSVLDGAAAVTEEFVEIAHLTTTIASEATLNTRRCDRSTDELALTASVDAEKVHLWTQLFLGKAARRLGANAVIVRDWEVEATCPPDPAFVAGEAVGEAVVGELLDAPADSPDAPPVRSRSAGPHVKLETTIRATAVRYLRSHVPGPTE